MKGHHKEVIRKTRERFLLLINPEKAKKREQEKLKPKEFSPPKVKKKKAGIID